MGEEVYIPRIDRWFEVRVQVIRWVDGQPAQLVVATDITALRPIRERQKQQEEQLQQTARLVTMGGGGETTETAASSWLSTVSKRSWASISSARIRFGSVMSVTEAIQPACWPWSSISGET